MTQDEIIELAKEAWISEQEAQLITEFDMAYISCTYLTDLVAFAKLVAAKECADEREACARFLETTDICGDAVMDELAEAIRARGTEA